MLGNKQNWMRLLCVALLCGLGWFSCKIALCAPETKADSLCLVDVDGTKIVWTLDDLRAMPQVVEDKCICVGNSSGFIGIFDYAGVRLNRLLAEATAAHGAGDYKKENMYVVFRGSDGYQVIASWTELTQQPHSLNGLVALEKDSKVLSEHEGPCRLLFPADKYVGRSVRNLVTIEIKVVDGVVERKKK